MTSTSSPEPVPRLRRWLRTGLLTGAALSMAAAQAGSLLEFDLWMQQIDHRSQDVLRHLQRQELVAALEDARALADLYHRMEGFYERRGNADDAVLASYVGRGQAEQAMLALRSGRNEEAYAQASALARDCRSCHERYKPMHD